jgi:hypothetical protein
MRAASAGRNCPGFFPRGPCTVQILPNRALSFVDRNPVSPISLDPIGFLKATSVGIGMEAASSGRPAKLACCNDA